MSQDEQEDTTNYKVVVNHEEQYSIWPEWRENPLGWRDAGKTGRKEECLAYIKEVWTDMRPLSLRKHMEQMARTDGASQPDSNQRNESTSSTQTDSNKSAPHGDP